jgi:hypothetical protein
MGRPEVHPVQKALRGDRNVPGCILRHQFPVISFTWGRLGQNFDSLLLFCAHCPKAQSGGASYCSGLSTLAAPHLWFAFINKLAEMPGVARVGHRNCLEVVEKRNTFPRQRLANHVPGATVFIRLPHCWGVA